MQHIISEIGLVIVFSSLVGLLLYYLKQPLVLAYILAGVLIGPSVFDLINSQHFIGEVAEIGIMLMLFLVGLEINTSRLKDLGMVSLLAGVGQVVFTSLIGFFIIQTFGFDIIQSLYLTIALTFSSTVIAVKIMSDKNDTKSFYGQICIGILIVQDCLAILALFFLAGFKEDAFAFDYMHFGSILFKGGLLFMATLLISNKLLKYVYNKIATSHELLILFSLGWCFLVTLSCLKIGFSMEIGAFIAGLSLANLPYSFEINSKTKILRDFFITIFFAALGSGMMFESLHEVLWPSILLSLFVLIGNPIIILVIMGFMGYDKKTAFFTGLTIANISEFSLIVVALGSKLGHLNDTTTSMCAIIAMITMVVSSYMITYNNQLYNRFKKYLSIFEFRKKRTIEAGVKNTLSDHIILLGCDQTGTHVLEQILSFKDDYVVVDHDNQVITKLIDKNINCVFGDVEDEDLLNDLDFEHAEMIISTLPNIEDNYILLRHVKKIEKNKRPIVIALSNSAREGLEISKRGADYVIVKPYLGAHHIHNLNKEIYQFEFEKSNYCIQSNTVDEKKHKHEHELALMLEKLNFDRLEQIKEKIKNKKINFRTKFSNPNAFMPNI